jgi:hypothetical protein
MESSPKRHWREKRLAPTLLGKGGTERSVLTDGNGITPYVPEGRKNRRNKRAKSQDDGLSSGLTVGSTAFEDCLRAERRSKLIT